MNKLVLAVALCSFGTVYAQGTKPAAGASGTTAAGHAGHATHAGASGTAATPSGGTAAPAGGETMMPPKPGAEDEALKPFVHSMSSTGTAMGPTGEQMKTRGRATCKWILNNLWAMCDINETAGTGKTAMKWQGHWMFGWDHMQKGYRGAMFDNMGTMMDFKGTMEGPKLIWESSEMKNPPPGMPSRMRFSQDATNPKEIKFSEEWFMNGKWVEHGTSTMKVSGGGK